MMLVVGYVLSSAITKSKRPALLKLAFGANGEKGKKKKKKKKERRGSRTSGKPNTHAKPAKTEKNSADHTGSSPRTILVFIRRLPCGARCDATCSPRLQPTRMISALEGGPPRSTLLPYLWRRERLRRITAVRCRWKKLVGVCLSAWFHATSIIPFQFPVQFAVSTRCLYGVKPHCRATDSGYPLEWFNLTGLDQADPRLGLHLVGVDRVPSRPAG
ncbi:hypothetical protein P168DRAFT_9152 [Aspergillus campestris IBT 28561]|uniref:Uncharacterized protein n=1 Tax=Aspergillus campestris (strain IBT 28561) TaxID=1392248 RepID=A0A2I1DE01_ASPC2|nr:uncharacterized protein P168DRAFT_9152 [Aspergillus campestris IBT 28561]PKY08112.1 hypothetical protein P168DRAFT_9152 [Aspergillus campestris IBT 28561]